MGSAQPLPGYNAEEDDRIPVDDSMALMEVDGSCLSIQFASALKLGLSTTELPACSCLPHRRAAT